MLGRSWRMNLSVRSLLGFLRLLSHLRVNGRQLVASGRHGHGGEVAEHRESGWGSGRAVPFGAAGQSAQISLISVTQTNKIQNQQLETMQREPLSPCEEVCWSCVCPRLGYVPSTSDPTVTRPCAVHRFVLVSRQPASLRTTARRNVLQMPQAVCPVTLHILWCYS